MKKALADNMLLRTLSGAVLLALVVVAVFLSPFSFLILIAVICAGCQMEFYRMARLKGAEPQALYGMAGGLGILLLVFFSTYFDALDRNGFHTAAAILLAVFFIPFVYELYRRTQSPLRNIAVTLTGILYIAVPLSLLLMLSMTVRGGYDPWLVFAYFAIIWINDIGAYVIGVNFGRHRLFERISPKKSWEGFFGGLVFAVGAAVLAGHLMGSNLWIWAGLGLVTALGGGLGDLVESMFKRASHIKDSGSVMPGHGGFLDRFDAFLFAAVPVYIYFTLLPL